VSIKELLKYNILNLHNFLMIDMNTGLKSDKDEASNKFIIVTDKEEEARKAMVVKRFGGNTKGAAIGGSGAQRRKSIAVHKSGEGKLK
jgi:hypothetical protein